MKLHFSHPSREHLSVNFGQFTQVVGQEQQLKYYIWQLLIWYFGGKKYTEEDLNPFNQKEPEISSDEGVLKRNRFNIISIAGVQDLVEQMTYKKGTVAFDFMKIKLNAVDIVAEMDDINAKLDQISLLVNKDLDLKAADIQYHTESHYFTINQLLLKCFSPYFRWQDQNISFEFVENGTKMLLFLQMLRQKLENQTDNILLICRNMDDYLTYPAFISTCDRLTELCETFPNFYCVIFPSSEGYLYTTKENIEHINIIADCTEHFYDFDLMYQRFITQYPVSQVPGEADFLKLLQRISSYLFSPNLEHVSLGISDLVAIKILNTLYQYDKKVKYTVPAINPLELGFLTDGH